MEITTEQIKQLRDKSGVSIMQCKKALEEANGDMEKAIMILKKKSTEIAAKKSDREAGDGIVVIAKDNNKAIMLKLNCETDFVAKNDDFVQLGNALVTKALADGVDAMQTTAPDMISPVVQKVGENIQVGEIKEISGDVIGTYVHNNKVGTIVILKDGTETLAKDVAMQITAMKPEYIKKEEIPADMIEKAKDLFRGEVEASDKPADIKEKMLEGKLNAYFKEQTLLDQTFFKNPEMTIAQLLASGKAEFVSYLTMSI